MLKVIAVISTMVICSLIYHYFFAEVPNYMETFEMTCWAILTTVVFCTTGLLTINKDDHE